MPQDFDPYHKRLGIAPKDQPPHRYRLLEIDPFEDDRDVIDAAANRVMSYLKDLATGDDTVHSQRLLNEVAQARVCLLNRDRKAAYDKELKAILSAGKPLKKKPEPRPATPAPGPLPMSKPVAPAVVKDGNLCTVKEYGDFELLVDWKIGGGGGGDSGIYLRGTPQIQIWDAARNPVGSGGLFNNKTHRSAPSLCADSPVGQWNTFRIKMIGERVSVWLNDRLVVDNEVMENFWERDKPIYDMGLIGLQQHRSKLYFRNIRIREIPRQQTAISKKMEKASQNPPQITQKPATF